MASPRATDSHSSSDSAGSLGARGLLRATPLLVRLGVSAWWRATEQAAEVSVRVGGRVIRGAAVGAGPAQILQDVGDELRDYVRLLVGVEVDGDQPAVDFDAGAAGSDAVRSPGSHRTIRELRELGKELLGHSTEVELDIDAHPAYEHILQELFPDEARILRFLAERGAQPAVDVRASGTLTVGKSRLVAPGLNMLVLEAGCLHPERNHRYLDNLHRLGLVWFSREELEDMTRYQVLEAQPEVAEALEADRGTQTVRRSIHLTPFGADFCRTCLPLDASEVDTLPREVD